MSRIKIIIIVIILISPTATPVAQSKRVKFGPVVSAYLTGLAEELNELEFQIAHKEISRSDYQKAKQRLTLLRQLVEAHARGNREDAVPEYQILADDELKTLGLSTELNPAELTVGAEFENQWTLDAIEPGGKPNRLRFFIFKRLRQKEISANREATGLRKRSRDLDLAAIETVVVNERPPESAPQASNGSGGAGSQDGSGNSGAGQHQIRIQLPQILNIQLPEYTGKARDRKVEGELVVRALFQRDGQIRDIKVGKALGYGLDQRAVETVKRIGFAPAQIDRQQVDAWVDVVFNFALTEVSVYVRASAAEVTLKGSN